MASEICGSVSPAFLDAGLRGEAMRQTCGLPIVNMLAVVAIVSALCTGCALQARYVQTAVCQNGSELNNNPTPPDPGIGPFVVFRLTAISNVSPANSPTATFDLSKVYYLGTNSAHLHPVIMPTIPAFSTLATVPVSPGQTIAPPDGWDLAIQVFEDVSPDRQFFLNYESGPGESIQMLADQKSSTFFTFCGRNVLLGF